MVHRTLLTSLDETCRNTETDVRHYGRPALFEKELLSAESADGEEISLVIPHHFLASRARAPHIISHSTLQGRGISVVDAHDREDAGSSEHQPVRLVDVVERFFEYDAAGEAAAGLGALVADAANARDDQGERVEA